MKKFNTTAACIPSKHYMVDLSDRIADIRKLVDAGKYFTINRARQYGKTTTIFALLKELKKDYYVVSMDFQYYGKDTFESSDSFCRDFSNGFCVNLLDVIDDNEDLINCTNHLLIESENDKKEMRFFSMFKELYKICKASDKPIVLIIDEVDSATNNQVFLDFLAQLRGYYIRREQQEDNCIFKSVILVGVTDIKHLKAKIREDDDTKENSPWNIAADFNIDMRLSLDGIKGMLYDYESDHNTGMDIDNMALLIRDYTNGYPFLVSRICELIDGKVYEKVNDLGKCWTRNGLDEAVKMILSEENTLFKSMTTKLNNMPKIKEALRNILMEGTKLSWNPDQNDIVILQMYGFIRNENNSVRIDNRIFETRLYNLFLSEEEIENNVFFREAELSKNIFVENRKLNVRLILEHFIETYTHIYGSLEEKFKEKDGREQFLLYLKPIINGTGNYYIEAQTRNQKRTDIIIDYLGQQYIIELKIWHGERYNEKGEQQISEYLNYFGLTTGYMLSFNFNKRKETGVKQVHIGDKILYEAVL